MATHNGWKPTIIKDDFEDEDHGPLVRYRRTVVYEITDRIYAYPREKGENHVPVYDPMDNESLIGFINQGEFLSVVPLSNPDNDDTMYVDTASE